MSTTLVNGPDTVIEGTGAGALWCCELELSGEGVPRAVAPPAGDESFVRVLVRLHGDPLGHVTVPFDGDRLDLDDVYEQVAEHFADQIDEHLHDEGLNPVETLAPGRPVPGPTSECPGRVAATELVSIVVHGRRGGYVMANCLARLRMLTYPHLEVIVVDSAAQDDSVSRIVDTVSAVDSRFRYVDEPRPGVASARNRGLMEAQGRYVAYTDEDVIVDPNWVEGLLRGFQRESDVVCVTGMVCPARVSDEDSFAEPEWSTRTTPELYRRDRSPEVAGVLYPYTVHRVGSGLDTAFDRDFLDGLGGFDEALGPGTRTRGGEDLDLFARTLAVGGVIAYEPAALVWRSAEADAASAETAFVRSVALSVVLVKCLVNPATRGETLRRFPAALRERRRVSEETGTRPRTHLAGMLAGPWLYARARLGTVPRWSADTADTAVARLAIAWLSLGGLVTGATALAVGADAVRLVSLLVYGLLGIGAAPWQINRSLRLPARLTLTMLTSLAVLTLTSMIMLTYHLWRPIIALAVVTAVCLPLHIIGMQMALRDLEAARRQAPITREGGFLAQRRGRVLRSPAIMTSTLGAILAVNSALAHRHLEPGFFGFLPNIGPAWYAGLFLVVLALALVRSDGDHELAVAVVLLVVVLTLTPALVYDGPRSQVAAKHVDLVLQIQQTHQLHSAIQIYNSWPGFFSATAWLCDIIGMSDPMRLATFWPALLGLFRIAALRYLFGQFLKRPYQAWIAVVLAVLADSIGADYFSPQSIGFVVGIAAIGLALSHDERIPRRTMILLAGCVLAVSHQLSPYTVGGILAVLVLFRQVRPWWTPALVLGPALIWALVHRGALSGFLSWEAIGRLYNFRPPKTVESPGLERVPVVNQASQALLLGIMIIGFNAAIGLVDQRRRLAAWAVAVCPAVGLLLVAVNPYGQEGIFRAALFGIPWLAILAALYYPSPRRVLTRIGVLGLSLALTSTFLISAFGLDAINVMRPSDVAAFRYFQQQRTYPITTNYVLALGAGDLPTSLPPQTGDFLVIRRDSLDDPVRQQPSVHAEQEVRLLTERFLALSRQPVATAHLYAVWSPVSANYGMAYGLQTPDQFVTLRDAFRHSPYWEVSFHEGGTYLFRFENDRYPGGKR